MSIQISPSVEANRAIAERVRRANRQIEPLLRQHSQTAKGYWDVWQDEHGRELLNLAISDPWGYASADFDPGELDNQGQVQRRVYDLIGWMINPIRQQPRRERVEVRDRFVTTEQLESFRLRLGELPNLLDAGIQLHNQVWFLPNRPNGFLLTDFALDVNSDRANEVRQVIQNCGFLLRDDAPLLRQPDIRAASKNLVDNHRR